MQLKYGFQSLALHMLLLLYLMNAKPEKIEEMQREEESLSSYSFQLKHTNQVFFNYNHLKLGKIMPIYFGGAFPSRIPQFLPKEKAKFIPFSSQSLPKILDLFGFDSNSPQAKAIQYTLEMCKIQTHEKHIRCVTSLEDMLDFAYQVFYNNEEPIRNRNNGIGEFFKVVSTSPLPKTSKLLQNYTIIKQPKHIPSTKMVPCHMLTYPYAVFKCHYQKSKDQLFQISLLGEDGAYVDAIANCHMNTSNWDPNYIGFRVLGFMPGTKNPICHFLPSNDLVWLPSDQMENYRK